MPSPIRSHLPLSSLHARFMALLPHIERYGRFYFCHIRCPQGKEEALQEMRALTWLWFLRLVSQGKDPADLSGALAAFAARRGHAGRRLCGQEKPRDVLSPRAQRLNGIGLDRLYNEALQDNTRTPPPDQVASRCDFLAWRGTRTDRDRLIMDDLMLGDRTLEVARKHAVSPARISQLRREFYRDRMRFGNDTDV